MINWIEDHPYLAGALAIALVLVFIVVRRMASGGASAGPSGVVYGGPSDQQIAAGTAVQAAQIQGQTTIAGYDAQVRVAELVTGSEVEKSRLSTILGLQNILSGADVLNNQTNAQLQYGLASLGHIPGVETSAPNTNVIVSSVPPSQANPTISTFAPTPSGNITPSGYPTGISPTSSFTPGETWDQYYASQLQGQPVNNPNVGYPDPSAVALRENIWAGAQTSWIGDAFSPHNLPVGDWYDSSGHLQSGPQPNSSPTQQSGDNCGWLNGVPLPCGIPNNAAPVNYSPTIALSDYSFAGMTSGAGSGRVM